MGVFQKQSHGGTFFDSFYMDCGGFTYLHPVLRRCDNADKAMFKLSLLEALRFGSVCVYRWRRCGKVICDKGIINNKLLTIGESKGNSCILALAN